MRTITSEDAKRNPAFEKYVGKTLSIKEINEIETGSTKKAEKPAAAPKTASAPANDPKDPADPAKSGEENK